MSGRVLAEDADARATVHVLEEVRSVVDVRVYVWQPRAKKWRLLSMGEQKAMWERAEPDPGNPSWLPTTAISPESIASIDLEE